MIVRIRIRIVPISGWTYSVGRTSGYYLYHFSPYIYGIGYPLPWLNELSTAHGWWYCQTFAANKFSDLHTAGSSANKLFKAVAKTLHAYRYVYFFFDQTSHLSLFSVMYVLDAQKSQNYMHPPDNSFMFSSLY